MLTPFFKYLGASSKEMLGGSPFNKWKKEKSYGEYLGDPVVYFEFPQQGLEIKCDRNEIVKIIFIFADKFKEYDNNYLGISILSNRDQVSRKFGNPSKSGCGSVDKTLGRYGPWDRFQNDGYIIHVEYKFDADQIKMITLSREVREE